MFAGFSQHIDMQVRFDREVITSFLDLMLPGLDELMALAELADCMYRGSSSGARTDAVLPQGSFP